MRRITFVLSMLTSVVVGIPPATAQDDLLPPSEEDAAVIAAVEALDDGFTCPAVPGAAAVDYEQIRASSGQNGVEVASTLIRIRCSYTGIGPRVTVNLEFTRKGVRPDRTCDAQALPYEGLFRDSRSVQMGQLRPPLAIIAGFDTRADNSDEIVAGLRAAAGVMADMVAPMAETCPTPLEVPAFDDAAAAQLEVLDAAAAVACQQLEIPAGVVLSRSAAPQSKRITTSSISVLDGLPTRIAQPNPRIECRYESASYTVALDVTPAVNERGFISGLPFPDRQNGCDGTDQHIAPTALTVTIEAEDDVRPYLEAQATVVADSLVALAVDCNVESAAYEAAIAEEAKSQPMESVDMPCPAIDGFTISAFNEQVGSPGPAAASMSPGFSGFFPSTNGTCTFEIADDFDRSIRLTLFVLPDGRSAEEAGRLCSVEDRPTSDSTFGRIVAEGVASMVDIVVSAPQSGDIGKADATAREWLEQTAALARTCADVEVTDVEALFEPLPPYLADAVEAGLAGTFALAPQDGDDSGGDGDDGGTARSQPAPSSAQGSDAGGITATLLRVARVVMLIVSLAGLALSLLLARRPSRIRPNMEFLRIVFALGGAAVMMTLFAVGAPLWAIAAALVGGAALGLTQGRNLAIVTTPKGLMAKRSALAIFAFAAGLVATQVAGLLNRNGVISIGLALSFLSGATAAGLVAGRRPALASARSAAASVALIIIAGAALGPSLIPPSAAQEAESETTGADALNDAVGWDEITLNGGVAPRQKPDLVITLDPSFIVAPDPVTRDLSIDGYIFSTFQKITGTETFSFELVDGICCDLRYSAEGTVIRQFLDGWEEPAQQLIVEQGSMGLVGPVLNFSDLLFDSPNRRGDGTCGRAIASNRTDVEQPDGLVALLGGEQSVGLIGPAQLWAPCELDISLTDAPVVPEPPPSAADPASADGGRQCPANQEVIDTMAAATTFDPDTSAALTRRFVQPNRAACWDSGIEFGEEGPGGVRSELTYYLARPDPDRALEFDQDGYGYINGGPRNSDLDLVCEQGADGVPLPSPSGECARVGFHQVVAPGGTGQIYILNDFDSSDGPNVTVRGVFPSGIFRYRCHHCLPGDPEVASMIQSMTAMVNQGASGGSLGTVIGTRGAPTALPLGAASGAGAATDDSPTNREAAAAGLIGLIAAMGITAVSLAESGLTAGDLLTSWREGGAGRVRSTLRGAGVEPASRTAPPATVLDEYGDPIQAGADDLYAWDTPDGTEMLDRATIEERIAAAREANAARDSRHEGIIGEHESDAAAAERFDDLGERSSKEDDAEMAATRAGWDEVDRLGALVEAQERAAGAWEVAEAEQRLATLRNTWGQIFSETAQASWNDATEIPGIMVDATRVVVQAATDPENWRILGEGTAETIYDVAGMAAGGTFGDATESIQQGAVTAGRVGVALGGQFIRHPVDTAAMFIPGRDLYDAMDGDRPLGARLGSVAMGVLDIGATLAGAGILAHADELVDASRAIDLAGEAVDTSRVLDATSDAATTARVLDTSGDAASTARLIGPTGATEMADAARLTEAAQEARAAARTAAASGNSADTARAMDAAAEAERAAAAATRTAETVVAPGRMSDAARLTEAAEEARAAARAAAATGNSADTARAMDALAEAEDAADAARRALFRNEGGMQAMGRAEAAGNVSDELAQSVVNMHDELTGAASRQGVTDAVDDFAGEFGFHPGEVMMGNSGSVGAGRSVLTDADRTIVASFTREQLDSAKRAGETYTQTQQRLQTRLSQLHQRAAELRLNSAADPAVILARDEGISLGEAVARLGDADDPAAAARRLTGDHMDMQSYAGFGAGAGQADAYPMGYTRARQSAQGSTEVFTFGDRASDGRNYSTSGQAIIDRNELGQMDLRNWDAELQTAQRELGLDTALANAADIKPGFGREPFLGLDIASDPTRISNTEMAHLFREQQTAMSHYDDAKSISKAVDRASYVAGRIDMPLPNQELVDAARTMRANPRATQAVLTQLGMSEAEYVASLKQMMRSYQPVFPS